MQDGFIPPHGNYKKLLSYQKTEIKLINVARASLEELLEDYRDFLRTRKFPLWEKDSKEAVYVRKMGQSDADVAKFRDFAETRPSETVANIAVCLICQGAYLLDRQLKSLERDFLKNGGLRERMSKARISVRTRQ